MFVPKSSNSLHFHEYISPKTLQTKLHYYEYTQNFISQKDFKQWCVVTSVCPKNLQTMLHCHECISLKSLNKSALSQVYVQTSSCNECISNFFKSAALSWVSLKSSNNLPTMLHCYEFVFKKSSNNPALSRLYVPQIFHQCCIVTSVSPKKF